MKKLMVLGAGLLQVSTIQKARELGYFTIALDGSSHAVGLKDADKAVVTDITDVNKVLEIARQEQIDGVIHPCSEVAMHSMGYVNDMLHLNGIGVDTVVKATNKAKMREAFVLGGAPSPKSVSVCTEAEALNAFHSIDGDVIVKPSRNSGSRGVSFIKKNDTWNETMVQAYHRAFNESRDASVVVEQFVEGPEFSVEILIWNDQIKVLTVTDKLTTDRPYFVELGHSQPSRFDLNSVEKIVDAAVLGVKALGLKQCVAHAEIKLAESGPYIMEIGARLGGDFISTELVHLSTGIDMVACAIRIALGMEPDLVPKTTPQGAAIRYFTPKPGFVKTIQDVGIWSGKECVYDIQLYIKEGDLVKPIQSSLDRSGHVITVGSTALEAVALAERIISDVQIITE